MMKIHRFEPALRPFFTGAFFAMLLVLAACSQSDSTAVLGADIKAPALEKSLPDSKITSRSAEELPVVMVYKSPTCGCCSKWVKHLEQAGFTVKTEDHKNMSPIKQKLGVPGNLASCHTAKVGRYVVEGHVPADDVMRLLREQPDIVGLAVPGMPLGSPGMEHPDPQDFKTLTWSGSSDRVGIWQEHSADVSYVFPGIGSETGTGKYEHERQEVIEF